MQLTLLGIGHLKYRAMVLVELALLPLTGVVMAVVIIFAELVCLLWLTVMIVGSRRR